MGSSPGRSSNLQRRKSDGARGPTTLVDVLPGVEVVRSDPAARVRELREAGNVLLLAGGDLVAELIEADLVDELYVIVEATALGAGRPLIGRLSEPIHLQVRDVQQHSPTCHVVRYQIGRG